MSEPVDDLCAQLGCLDGGICFREGRHAHLAEFDEPGDELHCHRALALRVGPALPYSLRLAVWRAFLRKIGLKKFLPTEPFRYRNTSGRHEGDPNAEPESRASNVPQPV